MAEPRGLLLEFADEDDCLRAIIALKGAGYVRLSAHVPAPSKRLERALGVGDSILSFLTFVAGMAGAALAYLVQWWTQAVDFPLEIGGHPTHGPLAFVAITFASGILSAGLMAFFGCWVLCGLPRWWHPLFELDGFTRASVDRYFVVVSASDPKFELRATGAEAEALGCLSTVVVGGGDP